ncbi:MAG TPA: glycosyltransferase family 4 protein [Bacteroidia bacterium]|nr:glycosyltransferase family 4 protein [Bacteroidia bacterium]
MKVLFLYTELASYFLKCCEELSKRNEVHIIRWPVNKEAPFEFETGGTIRLYAKKDYSFSGLIQLVKNINPDMIICSGWIDREYLRICRSYFGKIPTVMTCDTSWKGSFRQYLATALSRLTLLRIFSNAWVPGHAQRRYVEKLGFENNRIEEKFYCCDLEQFNSIYDKRRAAADFGKTKRFLYIGRYYDFKGLPELWDAFAELKREDPNDWELWCVGTGGIEGVQSPGIRHFGFVQPKDLGVILLQCTVFILPSRFEPWAVVSQEMAAAGFPLILSSAVGSAERFLEEGKNGYNFIAGDSTSLLKQMKKIIHLSSAELSKMSEHSHSLAQSITPAEWVNCVDRMYNGIKN